MESREFTAKEIRQGMEAQGVPTVMIDLFLSYCRLHPLIWKYFEALALAYSKMNKRVGSKLILEEIRREHKIEINNTFTAYFARAFVIKYPQYRKLFVLKAVKQTKIEQKFW